MLTIDKPNICDGYCFETCYTTSNIDFKWLIFISDSDKKMPVDRSLFLKIIRKPELLRKKSGQAGVESIVPGWGWYSGRWAGEEIS